MSNHGVEECYQIVAELRSQQEKQARPRGDKDSAIDPAQPGSHAEEVGTASASSLSSDGQSGMLPDTRDTPSASSLSSDGQSRMLPETPGDPVMAQAMSLATGDMCHITVCRELQELCKTVKARLLPTHKLVVLVDDETSRASVVAKHLDMLRKSLSY